MGNWNINIQGIGCHHNKNNPTDANLMALAFVASLTGAGHKIESATFTHGGKEELIDSPAARDLEVAGLNNEVHRLRSKLYALESQSEGGE